MDWLAEDRGEIVLSCIAFAVAALIVWILRRKLVSAIACVFVFLLVAATVIPSAIPARPTGYRNTCINNLRLIKGAKDEWARENHKLPTDIPLENDLYGTNGYLRQKLVCPRGGQYTFGAVNQNPTCTLADKGHALR